MRRTTLLSGRVFKLTPQLGIIRSILQSGSTKFSKLYHLNIDLAIRKKTEVNLAKSQNKKRKKASSEKFDQTLSSKRKVRRTLPSGNSQKEERSKS
jgi:hypothetical protein